MELHLIRHADAEPPRDGLLESDRALTDKGHKQAQTLHEALKRLEVQYHLILSSPMRRAHQTAHALERLGHGLETTELLAAPPGRELLEHLRRLEHGASDPIALVGHQPYLGELVALLLFNNSAAANHFEFKKSGLYAITWPDAPQLHYALTPGLTRRLVDG